MQLSVFSVSLVVRGVNLGTDPDAPQRIEAGIFMRPYIIARKVLWLEKHPGEVGVDIEIEGFDEDHAGRRAAEEIFEVVHGYLIETVGTSVVVVDIKKLD